MGNRRFLVSVFVFLLISPTIVAGQERGTIIVANMSENSVSLIDATTRETVATLPSGPSPHEVAVSESGEWAIITNYGSSDRVGNSLTLISVPDAELPHLLQNLDAMRLIEPQLGQVGRGVPLLSKKVSSAF